MLDLEKIPDSRHRLNIESPQGILLHEAFQFQIHYVAKSQIHKGVFSENIETLLIHLLSHLKDMNPGIDYGRIAGQSLGDCLAA